MAIHFTKQQIDEIEQALVARSKKDSQFPGADQLEGTELIPIIQNGANKVTTYAGLWSQVSRELREYVEQALQTKVDKVEGKELSENDFTDTLKGKLDGIESGAQVNVQSDWLASSGDAFIKNRPDLSIYATRAAVQDIEALIPTQASTSNQLADKNFVNSSIATSTAEFKGTYSSLAELETVSANNNDYGYVVSTDSVGNTVYDRYKYNGESWIYEYSLNNSSFTASEWAAIRSGITAELVTKLQGIATGAQVNVIEGVQVNGSDLPVVNKKVNVVLPTVTGVGDFQTEDMSDQIFLSRQTADGELDWTPSVATVEKIKGNSQVWNQLCPFTSAPVITNATWTNNTLLATAQHGQVYWNVPSIIVGHKYIQIAILKTTAAAGQIRAFSLGELINLYNITASGSYQVMAGIATATNTLRAVAVRDARSSDWDAIEVKSVMFIDLTLLGIDNFTTVEEVEAWLAENIGEQSYYDYTPGRVISFNGHYLKTTDSNQSETLLNVNPTELTSNGVQIFPYGLCRVGNAYDEVTRTEAIKRVGVVDLGTLVWALHGSVANEFYANVNSIGTALGINLLTSQYSVVAGSWNVPDKCVSILKSENTNYLIIKDSAYSTATAFKTAMSGVMLYYELATPVEYILDQPLNLNTIVDVNGTESIYPENTSEPYTTPICADIQYGLKAKEILSGALTAKKLFNARKINGTAFDGTQDITTDKWGTSRNITIQDATGDNTGDAVAVDGSENKALKLPAKINAEVTRNLETTRSEEFSFMPVPVNLHNGAYSLDVIKGKSLVWNQLVQNGNFASSDSWVFQSANGSISNNAAKFTATAKYGLMRTSILNLLPNHKYYIGLSITFTSNEVHFQMRNNTQSTASTDNVAISGRNSAIFTYSGLGTDANYIRILDYATSDWAEITVKNVFAIDLTLMFGAGNEPSTVEEFEALYPLPYYAFNECGIINNKTEQIESVGFNQWDEQWEGGSIYYTTGQDFAASGYIRSKEYIPVIAGKTYYIKAPANTNLIFYDATKAFVDTGTTYINKKDTTFTVPSGVAFLRFALGVGTYANDICINISDPAKNGTYEPYKKSVLNLGLDAFKVKSPNIWNGDWSEQDGGMHASNISVEPDVLYYFKVPSGTLITEHDSEGNTVASYTITNATHITSSKTKTLDFLTTSQVNDICINKSRTGIDGKYFAYGDITVNGLNSAGDVYDEISGGKYIKRIGVVDMGTLEWDKGSYAFYLQRGSISSFKGDGSAICAKYVTVENGMVGQAMPDKALSVQSGQTYLVYITDSAYTDAAAFKAAMSGVPLYYELATQEVYDLAEPFLNIGRVYEDGTIRALPYNTDPPQPKFAADITYGVNAGTIVDKTNSIIDSFKDKLETLWDAVFNNS